MHEIELKFQVPEASRVAVARAVATVSAQSTPLKAAYYDTADRRLAAQGVALRLRKEGRRWVQTVKALGEGTLHRLEHNVPVAGAGRTPPAFDVARHAGTPAGARLAAALGDAVAVETFRTDIDRLHRVARVPGGQVELAFDTGRLLAGPRSLAVCELEFELLRGRPVELIALARRWVARHRLWLDVRSKAERGDRLARDVEHVDAVKARPTTLGDTLVVRAARAVAIRECLAQALPNASEIAGGSHQPEHVHQLRVALRRLRSLLRFLDTGGDGAAAALGDTAARLFRDLGAARDQDALAEAFGPVLRKAGAPRVDLPAADDGVDVGARLREPDATLLWLDLLAEVETLDEIGGAASAAVAPKVGESVAGAGPTAAPTGGPAGGAHPAADDRDAASLRPHARRRLKRWHDHIAAAPGGFLSLSDEDRHRLRKRVRRLRYAVEFVASLYRRKAVKRYVKRLRVLQERLGDYNDLVVADAAYRRLSETDPAAWFAVGWAAARRLEVEAECAAALKAFARAKPFWRKA